MQRVFLCRFFLGGTSGEQGQQQSENQRDGKNAFFQNRSVLSECADIGCIRIVSVEYQVKIN
jgi:hypothetical protein